MKFALCAFIAAFTYATAAVADVTNDKLCIRTALNLLKVAMPERSSIRGVNALAPPAQYETAAPVTSRLVEIKFKGPGDWKNYYICKTQPGRQLAVTYIGSYGSAPY